MVRTDVTSQGNHEHEVRVHIPQHFYDAVYAEKMQEMSAKANIPGFRAGKIPAHVMKKQFGSHLHEETVSTLLQNHYAAAIESSGLIPAVQPLLNMPTVQPEEGLSFTLTVTTWPDVALKDLSSLTAEYEAISVDDSDVDKVIDRLMESQVRYIVEEDRAAVESDKVKLNFTGYIDDEAFEGGSGSDVDMVLGAGQFLPDFETGATGMKAGETKTIEVAFPEDYGHAPLAGKTARFELEVLAVERAEKPNDRSDLANIVGFDDAEAMVDDIRQRLQNEAKQGSENAEREAVFKALLDAHEIALPEALIAKESDEVIERMKQSMKSQNMNFDDALLQEDAFKENIRERAERNLRVAVVLNAIRDEADIQLDEAAIDAELDRLAMQYPEEQRASFKQWILSQEEQKNSVLDQLVERSCIAYIVEKMQIKTQPISLSDWQARQEAEKAEATAS